MSYGGPGEPECKRPAADPVTRMSTLDLTEESKAWQRRAADLGISEEETARFLDVERELTARQRNVGTFPTHGKPQRADLPCDVNVPEEEALVAHLRSELKAEEERAAGLQLRVDRLEGKASCEHRGDSGEGEPY